METWHEHVTRGAQAVKPTYALETTSSHDLNMQGMQIDLSILDHHDPFI
jgi:hypothetical protein